MNDTISGDLASMLKPRRQDQHVDHKYFENINSNVEYYAIEFVGLYDTL